MSYSPIISPAQAPATTEAPAIDYKTSYELLVEVSTETENKLEETEYKLDETEDELEETKQKLIDTQRELDDLKQKFRALPHLIETWASEDSDEGSDEDSDEYPDEGSDEDCPDGPYLPEIPPQLWAANYFIQQKINESNKASMAGLQVEINKLSDDKARLEKENTDLKAEMSQIDFLSAPQVDTATELQRLKQQALLKYNNLENTPDDESHHVGKAHLEYQACVAAQETYLTFLSLPDECDGW